MSDITQKEPAAAGGAWAGGNDLVRVVTSREGIEALRPDWERLQAHPHADIDWLLEEWDLRGQAFQPYIVVGARGDEVRALMVGRIEIIRCELALGYRTLWAPERKGLSFLAGCCIGVHDEGIANEMLGAVLRDLRSGAFDVVRLLFLPVDGPLFRAARRCPSVLQRDYVIRPMGHWRLAIPPSLDGLFSHMKPKHRSEAKRACRQLVEPGGPELGVRFLSSESEVEDYAADALAITTKSYLAGLGLGYLDSALERRRLTFFAGRGQWLANIVYVDGAPASFWSGFLYRRVYFAATTGHDPAKAKALHIGIGIAGLAVLLQRLCEAGLADEGDLGNGDYVYKQRFGTDCTQEATVFVFAPSLSGSAFNLLRTSLYGIELAVRAVLDRLGIREAIKRAWRGRLAKARPDPEDGA